MVKNTDSVNPYESPTPWESEKGRRESIAGRVVGATVLAMVGYGVFAVVAGFYYLLSLAFSAEPVVSRWTVGVLCAIAFASSEVFNSGCGRKAGVMRRVLVASGVTISSLIVAAFFLNALGLYGQTYEEKDRWLVHSTALLALVYVGGLWLARYVWIVQEFRVEVQFQAILPARKSYEPDHSLPAARRTKKTKRWLGLTLEELWSAK
jgi:hypothetical protein